MSVTSMWRSVTRGTVALPRPGTVHGPTGARLLASDLVILLVQYIFISHFSMSIMSFNCHPSAALQQFFFRRGLELEIVGMLRCEGSASPVSVE